ncbi:MAG: formimidoylglutamate deiminase [Ilumatobacteraceae bacterium]
MTSYWCEFAWLGGDHAVAGVLVSVDGDRISAVQPGVPCPPDAVLLKGLTVPGMANAHSHAFHRALRGRTHVGGGSFWTWRDQMYGFAQRLDPQRYFDLARAVYAEMAMAGITAVGEFHYLHHGEGGRPYVDANAMSEALLAAAGEAGIRITLLDTCYLHGGVGLEPNEVQRRFSDGSAAAWVERVDAFRPTGTHALVGAAVHSVRAVDPESIAVVADWADRRAAVLHAHVSEQPAENEQTVAAFGLTPTQLLAERGALSDRFTAVHATHLTPGDIGLLGGRRCAICMCPTTERDLADGIGPAASLRAAGATITLGSDSHAVIDLFEEARAVELNERLATRVRGHHHPADLWRAATEDGQRSIGWTDAGALRAGAVADLVSVRLDSVRTAGADAVTALDTVLYAATAADVHSVVVSGRLVVRDGHHHSIDVPAALAAAIAAVSEDA